jgi:hypothetical protein
MFSDEKKFGDIFSVGGNRILSPRIAHQKDGKHDGQFVLRFFSFSFIAQRLFDYDVAVDRSNIGILSCSG